MVSRKRELEKQVKALREELDEIETREQIKETKKLVGKCFKYRNCYSCPESEGDYWWLYSKVLDQNKEGDLHTLSFEKDKYNKVNIEWGRHTNPYEGDSYIPIKEEEFAEAWTKLLQEIETFYPRPVLKEKE